MDGPTIATVIGTGIGIGGLLWKIRKDEIEELKAWMSLNITAKLNAIEPEMARLQKELETLRTWRHDFGQKEGVYDDYNSRIRELEDRLRRIESGKRN